MSIFETSLSGALMIIIVLFLRVTILNYVPKTVFLWLWYTTTARLLVPISIASPLSIVNIYQIILASLNKYPSAKFDSTLYIGYLSDTTVKNDIFPIRKISIIWIIGCICVFVFLLLFQIVAKCHKKHLIPIPLEEWNTLWENESIPKKIKVYYGDTNISPAVSGLFFHTIVLPLQYMTFNEKERSVLLYHELVHVRRHDNLFHALMLTILIVYWFNPLVWVMCYFALRDIEISCDEAVIRKMGESSKRFYADLLIKIGSNFHDSTILTKKFGSRDIKERLISVMKYKNTGRYATAFSIFVVLILSLTFATTPPHPIKDKEAIVRKEENFDMQNVQYYQNNQIPLQLKTTVAGYAGAHIVPSEEIVLYTQRANGWELRAGQSLQIFVNIRNKNILNKIVLIGYMTEKQGEYVPVFVDYLQNDLSLSFTAPKDDIYYFYIYANSSNPLSIKSIYIIK